MSDRTVIIVVSVLLLAVMCALLLVVLVWVPSRTQRIEGRLDRLEDISAQVMSLHDRFVDLDRLEKKLGDTSTLAAPLTRIDGTVDEIRNNVKEVAPAVRELKERMTVKSDLDKLAGQISQLEQKLLAAGAKSDPETAKLAKQISDVHDQVEALRKLVDSSLRDMAKDIKQLNLEIQKLHQK